MHTLILNGCRKGNYKGEIINSYESGKMKNSRQSRFFPFFPPSLERYFFFFFYQVSFKIQINVLKK